jgi:hypothetical protein
VKVVSAGFGRTGTMSLKVAPEELGAGPRFDGFDQSAPTSANRAALDRGASSWTELNEEASEVETRPQLHPRRSAPRISGLAVADAETTLSQEEVLTLLGLKGDEFAEGIFARCGVRQRHLNLSEDFLADTLQGRAARVEEELLRYSIRAIDQLGIDPREIGTVVSASLYSLGCPTLAHRLIAH